MSEFNTGECGICSEKLKVIEKDVIDNKADINILKDKVNEDINNLKDKVNEVDKRANTLEISFTSKLNEISTEFKIYNNITFEKLGKLEGKIDKIVGSPKEEDAFKSWLQSIGLKFLEYGILGGAIYLIITKAF